MISNLILQDCPPFIHFGRNLQSPRHRMNKGTSGAYGGPMKWPECALSNFIKLAEISIDLLATPKATTSRSFRTLFQTYHCVDQTQLHVPSCWGLKSSLYSRKVEMGVDHPNNYIRKCVLMKILSQRGSPFYTIKVLPDPWCIISDTV
jgi:hypothetical protein